MLSVTHSTLCAFAAAVVASAVAMPADAGAFRTHRQIPSWYFALGGSVNYVDDTDLSETSGGATSRGDFTLDEGAGLFGAIGYRPRYTNSFWDNTRFEIEFAMASNDVGTVTSSSGALPALSGNLKSQRVMANLLFDLDTGTAIRPYFGGGLGVARLSLDGGDDSVFAYQGLAGITYTPTSFPLLEFGLGYRYVEAPDASLTSGTTGGTLDFDYGAHSVEAAIRAYF